jgi:hypothetical protein
MKLRKKIAEKMGFQASSDDRYKILEMHVNIDLPGYEDEDEDGEKTGIALPYVVTIEKQTETVLAIRRNWNQDDPLKAKRNHFVHYGYIPAFGFYCFGLIHLLALLPSLVLLLFASLWTPVLSQIFRGDSKPVD